MPYVLSRGMAENFVEPCDLILTMPYAPLNHRMRKTPMLIVGYQQRYAAYEMWVGHKLTAENRIWPPPPNPKEPPRLTKHDIAVWVLNAPKFRVDLSGLTMETGDVFPLELPRRLLAAYPGKKDVVADPFMGRGTVGLAVGEYGGTFIGIDRMLESLQVARELLMPKEADAA